MLIGSPCTKYENSQSYRISGEISPLSEGGKGQWRTNGHCTIEIPKGLLLRLLPIFPAEQVWYSLYHSTTCTRVVLVNVPPTRSKKRADSAIAWITVTYRSVILSVIGAIILAGIGFNFAFPKTTENIINASGNLLGSLLAKIGGSPAVKPPPKVGDQKEIGRAS